VLIWLVATDSSTAIDVLELLVVYEKMMKLGANKMKRIKSIDPPKARATRHRQQERQGTGRKSDESRASEQKPPSSALHEKTQDCVTSSDSKVRTLSQLHKYSVCPELSCTMTEVCILGHARAERSYKSNIGLPVRGCGRSCLVNSTKLEDHMQSWAILEDPNNTDTKKER